MSSRSSSSLEPPKGQIKRGKTRIRNNTPFLESDFFDWNLVTEFNPDEIAAREDVDAMNKIISAFLLCQFNRNDFDVVQVPIVFNLLKLLQVSLSYQMNSQTILESENKDLEAEVTYLKDKGERVRTKLSRAIEEAKKWKNARRCPVCNAAFTSSETVDTHVKKFHAHVYNAWICVKNNEPDKSTVDTEALLKEVVKLRRQVLEQNKTLLPVRQRKNEPDLQTLEEKIGNEKEKRGKEGHYPEPEPHTMRLAPPCAVIDVKPIVDVNADIEIPTYLQKRVDRFFNPQTRPKKATESIDQVSDRIARMLKSNPEAVAKESEMIRKRLADKVESDHVMPTCNSKRHLRIGGERYYQAEFHQSMTSLMAANVDTFSDAEYSMLTNPEDEQAMSSSKAQPKKKKQSKAQESESKKSRDGSEQSEKSQSTARSRESQVKEADEESSSKKKIEEEQKKNDGDDGVVRLFAPRPKKPAEPIEKPMNAMIDKIKEEPKPEEPPEEKDPGNCSLASLGPESPVEEPPQPKVSVKKNKAKPESSEFASSSEDSGLRPVVSSESEPPPKAANPGLADASTSDEVVQQPAPEPQPEPPKPKPKARKKGDDFDDWDDPIEMPKAKPVKKKQGFQKKTKQTGPRTRRSANPFDEPD